MKSSKYFLLILPLLLMGLVACQKDTTGSTSLRTIKIYLTDHATPVFDSVFIDLRTLEVKLEDDSIAGDGWVTLAIRPGVYNILRFRNGLDTLFSTGTLPGTRIRKLRLTLGTQNSVMKAGISTPLRIDDNEREVVANIDDLHFEITATGEILFWIDFDAGRSIQVDNSGSGSGNGYRLKSHIKIFSRRHTGEIEGKVLPGAADPIVKAVLGTDTTTAIPRSDGEYRIVGLDAGTYRVYFDGQSPYIDTTVLNVVVRNGEDTHLPTITLRN